MKGSAHAVTFFFFAEVASDCPLAPEEIATISIFMYTMEGIQKKQVNLPVKKSYLDKKKSLTTLLALTFMSFAPYVDKIWTIIYTENKNK